MDAQSSSVGTILQRLADHTSRPRYAFMVLNLIAEVASPAGKAGPLVAVRGESLTIRDWLCHQLMPIAARDGRREKLRGRIAERLKSQLTGDEKQDEQLIDAALGEEALKIGKANVSRAVSDLVRAGLVRRHYAGRLTNHANRGGGRTAVYTVDAEALAALRRRTQLL